MNALTPSIEERRERWTNLLVWLKGRRIHPDPERRDGTEFFFNPIIRDLRQEIDAGIETLPEAIAVCEFWESTTPQCANEQDTRYREESLDRDRFDEAPEGVTLSIGVLERYHPPNRILLTVTADRNVSIWAAYDSDVCRIPGSEFSIDELVEILELAAAKALTQKRSV